VPKTIPLGRVNQKEIDSPGLKPLASKTTRLPGPTTDGVALASLLPDVSQDWAWAIAGEPPPSGARLTAKRTSKLIEVKYLLI
jgi:hypothetical protein